MPQSPVVSPPAIEVVVPPRQCGRCRGMFEGDPSLSSGPLREWWLCANCRSILLPSKDRSDKADRRPTDRT